MSCLAAGPAAGGGPVRPWSNRYVLFVLGMWLLARLLAELGGAGRLSGGAYIEWLLLLYLYWLGNQFLRPGRWTPFLAALPVVLVYLGHDMAFMLFGSVPRLILLQALPELLGTLPVAYLLPLLAVVLVPVTPLAWRLRWRPERWPAWLPILALAAWIGGWPGSFVGLFEAGTGEVANWSDRHNVARHGRLAMLLYHEARRRLALQDVAGHYDRAGYEAGCRRQVAALAGQARRRNVHLVVLESFVDPTLFAGARYSLPPRHPDFQRLAGDGMGFSISPVFGGDTAQAEFEVLCGVPAYRELFNAEFNAFSGREAQAWCLPRRLRELGYRGIATNAYKPDFFNAIPAYEGVGFDESHFPHDYAPERQTYLTRPVNAAYLPDDVLFEANLAYVGRALREHPGRPLLNYVLTAYGHFPHRPAPGQPPLIEVDVAVSEPLFGRAVNQHYYRTRALARYVEGLLRLDPDALIILIGDHLPPLGRGPASYRALGYLGNAPGATMQNRLLVLLGGVPVRYPALHHYDIPSLVLDILTDGGYCAGQSCNLAGELKPREAYRPEYLRLMAHAIRP